MKEEFEYYDNIISEMLEDNAYEFAWDTLDSMQKSGSEYNNYTDKMKQAIDNIYRSVNKEG